MVPQNPHFWTVAVSVSPWMHNQDEYAYWIGRALVLIIWPVDVCNNGRKIQVKAPWNFLLSCKLVNQSNIASQIEEQSGRDLNIYIGVMLFILSLFTWPVCIPFYSKKTKKNQAQQIIASNIHLTRCYFKLQLLCQMCNFTGTDLYSL